MCRKCGDLLAIRDGLRSCTCGQSTAYHAGNSTRLSGPSWLLRIASRDLSSLWEGGAVMVRPEVNYHPTMHKRPVSGKQGELFK